MKRFVLSILRTLAKVLVDLFYKNKIVRMVVFDGTPKSQLLLTPRLANHNGIFVVSPNDPVIGRDLFLTGEFDIKDHRNAFSFLQEKNILRIGGITLVDVGANIGAVSIPWLLEGLAERVFAAEPEPKNFSMLMASVYLNNLQTRFEGYQCAISENNENLRLNIHYGNEGGHFIATTNQGPGIIVEARRFDDVFKDIRRETHVVKIDVEGHEGQVLAGATETLKSGVPLIMEFMPFAIKRGSGFAKLKKHLLSGNYRFFIALQHSMDPIPLDDMSISSLFDKLDKHDDYGYVDLLVF